jgi:hypothetical protein
MVTTAVAVVEPVALVAVNL